MSFFTNSSGLRVVQGSDYSRNRQDGEGGRSPKSVRNTLGFRTVRGTLAQQFLWLPPNASDTAKPINPKPCVLVLSRGWTGGCQ